jgi:hypothetical protein
LELARGLMAGKGFVSISAAYGGIEQRAFYPPLYPVLLAIYGTVIPLSQATICAFNFAIDCATAWLISKLAKEIGVKPLGAVAIYLLWPSNVLLSPLPLKEGLASLLVVAAALFAVQKSAPKLGIATGLLALTQPALVPLPFILALLFRVPKFWMVAAASALVMAPWWIRNFFVFGTFVPLTTGGGYGLYVGTFSEDGWWLVPPRQLLTGGELQFSSASASEAWNWITAHPAEYLWRCFAKLGRGVVNGWWPVDNLMRMRPVQAWVLALLPISIGVTAILTTLSIFGAAVSRGVIGRLLLTCLLQIVLFNIWFEFSERHTYFIVPFLALATAAGAQHVLQDLRKQKSDIGKGWRGKTGSPARDI